MGGINAPDFPVLKSSDNRWADRAREWRSRLAIIVAGFLAFSTLSGLAIWLLPFSVTNQVMVIAHTAIGLIFLVPCAWYLVRHTLRYWRNTMNHILLLGYVGAAAVIVCAVSGVVLTYQSALATRISYAWDAVHIITTIAIVAFVVPHLLVIILRDRKARAVVAAGEVPAMAGPYGLGTLVFTLASLALVALAAYSYRGPKLDHTFPVDYSYKYGKDRPFAPSLARTENGGAMDSRVLAGSRGCGTSGCHEEIMKEWDVSAHRWAAMDAAFQAIQTNMAKQNGPESTRYCGGCHDPISLFSGTKNLFIEEAKLTALSGFQEGVSCLSCHSVRKVDVKGNANYIVAQPARYMFEMEYDEQPTAAKGFLRDFLIRSYPRQHVDDLGKRLFKSPEYCAACHKQFVDQEINAVGWVQLQNQYDNWRQSRWNHPGDARKTIECRECHMPLVDSSDPASGDVMDYNRTKSDRKHRSHRFVAANQMMPMILKMPGWEEQVELTQKWLEGKFEIPEIAHKWQRGPAVAIEVITPERVAPGEKVDVKLVMTSNKVGHDFPTGPLDIIQAWVELTVKDDQGKVVYSIGKMDDKGFIEPGTFMFKAEPVDQNGNLIDRHNLWEMVGVRYRRSLFPGFSDTTEFSFLCPQTAPVRKKDWPQEVKFQVKAPQGSKGSLTVHARLRYRKVDQFLLNFMFGKEKGLTAPITDMDAQTKTIQIAARSAGSAGM